MVVCATSAIAITVGDALAWLRGATLPSPSALADQGG